MAAKYEALVDSIADAERVPRAVAQALVDTENPKRDPTIILREAWGGGSHGLTMITLATATKTLGFRGTSAQLIEPSTNLAYGLRYFRQMYDQVGRGDWGRARWAYNVGPDLDPPWPAADKARFINNLARWAPLKAPAVAVVAPAAAPGPAPPAFQKPPILRAGIGGWLMPLILVGWLLPMLFSKRKRRA